MRALVSEFAGSVSAAEFHDETANLGSIVYRPSRLFGKSHFQLRILQATWVTSPFERSYRSATLVAHSSHRRFPLPVRAPLTDTFP